MSESSKARPSSAANVHAPAKMNVRVTRSVPIPNRLRLARCAKAPEYGPRILFFSGGTALNPLCRELIDYTHNSIHLITPFDSGGSSAALREAFDMPAVGDLRNRLMALADHTVIGQPAVFDLFAFRFPREETPDRLRAWLDRMIGGEDERIRRVENPLRKLIRNHLRFFAKHMPSGFDLRGASIGNLILVGGFLINGRQLDPVVFLFSKLVEVRGTVRPIVGRSAHLAAELAGGEIVRGQRLITGKESPPLTERIERVHLIGDCRTGEPQPLAIRHKVRELIASAELICYPMGSFYTSVIANLLPDGVGEAIAANDCPKVYIPNTGIDPELRGITVEESVRRLLAQLRATSCSEASELLDFVVLDEGGRAYPTPPDVEAIRSLGVEVISFPLVTPESSPYLDAERLLEILLSLA